MQHHLNQRPLSSAFLHQALLCVRPMSFSHFTRRAAVLLLTRLLGASIARPVLLCDGAAAATIPSEWAFPGPSEEAHAKPRAWAAQDLTEGHHRQWLPHRILDDEAGGRGDSKNLSRAVPFRYRWPTPSSVWVDSPEARTASTGAGRKGHRALEAGRLAAGKKTPPGWVPT
jgi:hypothetical protein